MAVAKSCRKIEVLVTANEILDCLASVKEPASIAEIARYTGVSMDITFRQIGTMADLHWVEKIGEGYILGMKIAILWARRKAIAELKIEKATKEFNELTGGNG